MFVIALYCHRVMPTHSCGWTEHETNCSNVCSLSLEQWQARLSGFRCAPSCKKQLDMIQLPLQGHNCWWIMAVHLWPGNKAAVFAMEDAILSTTEKACQVRSNIKSMLTFFFWHSRNCA
jgi:hypothetical protein